MQYVQVQECDVLKNFAFIHVVSESDADIAIQKLDKYRLEGKEIHIERSTSRLRKEPGMGDKCFTCGALDHKTPQCPHEGQNRANKRPGTVLEEDLKKRFMPTNLPSNTFPTNPQPKCWGYSLASEQQPVDPVTHDPELPCPLNPELKTLYEQYLESRTRYFFYRERLTKEMKLVGQQLDVPLVAGATSVHLGRLDLTSASKGQVQNSGAAALPNIIPSLASCSPLSNYGYGVGSDISEAKYIPSPYTGPTPSATYSALPTTYAPANPPPIAPNLFAYNQPATTTYPSWSSTTDSASMKYKRSPDFYNNQSPR
uniref:RRM domain-containing protein n=1 Tax=Ditylenchus dipsaci TaxID=166011 RepID=A0A915D175_9BILA